MAEQTSIEWCDSTLNLVMGCNGCELWNPRLGIKDCYAGVMTERYAGKNGWPVDFNTPKLFPHRLDQALRWEDLTGKERAEKPWLSDLPRTIFLDDMSDTFTESLPLDWLDAYIERMAESHHILILLTKRAQRMAQYFKGRPVPSNFWLGITITNQETTARLKYLLKIDAPIKWVSFEPLLGPITIDPVLLRELQWSVVGGGSHMVRLTRRQWLEGVMSQLIGEGVPAFFKQWGNLRSNPDPSDPTAKEDGGSSKGGRVFLGSLWNEMPSLPEAREVLG